MKSTYDLSWGETSFFSKLFLFLKSIQHECQKMHSDDKKTKAEGYSALSSTYYSITGTGNAQLKSMFKPSWFIWLLPLRLIWFTFTWFPLIAWCYWRMLPLSNRVVELIGYEGMTGGQCDVRQSILRRRWHLAQAVKCIESGLKKETEKMHTYGLLWAGMADIFRKTGNWRGAEASVGKALKFAEMAEKTDPRQAARIYRHCADITDFVEQGDPIPGSQLRDKAQKLASRMDAKDQFLKITTKA